MTKHKRAVFVVAALRFQSVGMAKDERIKISTVHQRVGATPQRRS
jgi:hypothetical protein